MSDALTPVSDDKMEDDRALGLIVGPRIASIRSIMQLIDGHNEYVFDDTVY